MSASALERNPLEALAEDFLERYRRGERPALTEYADKHPELAAQIRALFPTLAMMEEADPCKLAPDGPYRGAVSADGKSLERLGDYRILREVARGGMGVVYEAIQESLGRHVALKVLPYQAAVNSNRLARFQLEARAAANLHHTNIVPVFDVGVQDGVHYFAMQFIQGQGLDEVLRELRRLRGFEPSQEEEAIASASSRHDLTLSLAGGLTMGRFSAASPNRRENENEAPTAKAEQHDSGGQSSVLSGGQSDLSSASDFHYYRSVARLGRQAADALAYAHSQKVLHRDIKPSNLLLDMQGTIWITDFGLAKDERSDITRTGDVVGTLRYMAPERFEGKSDARSDIYSLGLTLYEMLALRPAFAESDRVRLIKKSAENDPPRPRVLDSRIPRDLETIVLKAMSREPQQRYTNAADMADDLGRFLADRPILARRVTTLEQAWRWARRNPPVALLAASLVLVFLGGFLGVLWKWQDAELARQDEREARSEADDARKDAQDHAQALRQELEKLNAANSLLFSGHTYADRLIWDKAESEFTRAIKLRPDHSLLWMERANLYVRLGLSDLAAADMQKAFDIHEPTSARPWFYHALLRLHVADAAGYRRVLDRMRVRFQSTDNAQHASELARACLLNSDPNGDAIQLVQLAAKASLRNEWFHSCLYVLGIAHYRAGQYEMAIERCLESLRDEHAWEAKEINYPILAMAYHRLGRGTEARRALSDAAGVIDVWTENMLARPSGYSVSLCLDWLEGQRYYREAKLLIERSELPPDWRAGLARGRAMAAIGRQREAWAETETARRHRLQQWPAAAYWRRVIALYYAERKQWKLAIENLRQALEAAPDEPLLWFELAVANLGAGKTGEYRRLCAAMVERFRNTRNPDTAWRLVYGCSLAPDAVPNIASLRLAAGCGFPWFAGSSESYCGWLYRAGNYEAALRHLEQAMTGYFNASHCFFLAMSCHRLGQSDKARLALDKGIRWMEEADRTGPYGGWYQYVAFPALRREAEDLVLRRVP